MTPIVVREQVCASRGHRLGNTREALGGRKGTGRSAQVPLNSAPDVRAVDELILVTVMSTESNE